MITAEALKIDETIDGNEKVTISDEYRKSELDYIKATTDEIKERNKIVEKNIMNDQQPNVELGSIDGIILRVEKDTVEVKFNEKSIVSLPKNLFDKKEENYMGRKIKYAVMKRKNDFKFDKIFYPKVSEVNPEFAELEDLMEDF